MARFKGSCKEKESKIVRKKKSKIGLRYGGGNYERIMFIFEQVVVEPHRKVGKNPTLIIVKNHLQIHRYQHGRSSGEGTQIQATKT